MLRAMNDGPLSDSTLAAPCAASSFNSFTASLTRLVPPWLMVTLLWALLFLPFAGTRALYYEEGRYTLAALDMLAHGHWLRPEVLGIGFVEKPPLLFWLIAAASGMAGGSFEWAARAPALIATLLCAILCERAAHREAGPVAGFMAAIAFLVSPFILSAGARGEPDTLVTATSFAAFLAWLEARERVGAARLGPWLLTGLLLILVALCKGPQPLAFFAIGAVLLALLDRRWRELPELAVLGVIAIGAVMFWGYLVYQPGDGWTWEQQMRAANWPPLGPYLIQIGRFFVETVAHALPWLALAVPALGRTWRRRWDVGDRPVRVMACYAFGCTAILVFWPHAEPRYAMPAVPAIAVLAGLGGAALWRQGPRLAGRAVALLLVLAIATRIVWLIAIPFETMRNHAAQNLAHGLAAPIGPSRDPILVLGPAVDYNGNFYLQRMGYAPRQIMSPNEISGPAWLITAAPPPAGAREVAQVPGRKGFIYHLYRIESGG